MANKKRNYQERFDSFKEQTLYAQLSKEEQEFIREQAFYYQLTFQEFRQVVESARDLAMWCEPSLKNWWQDQPDNPDLQRPQQKQRRLQQLQEYMENLRKLPKAYPPEGLPRPSIRTKKEITSQSSDKKIYGLCPVASDVTVCCRLLTIDAVENCAFGCSYCVIQSFYGQKFVFDKDFAAKLEQIPIDPQRYYHFGTGQSSDSLVWGNKHGVLDALFQFADQHPNIVLEFKTKSKNIDYFLEHQVPSNVFCSWSINPPTIIQNEEHFTASLEERLQAARQLADQGIKVAFHFHPIVYYHNWDKDYPCLASRLIELFSPEEVVFVSLGSVTFIKPAMQKIRASGQATKTLQMELVPAGKGKFSYPDQIKIEQFQKVYHTLQPWHDKVYMYICMEKALIWEKVFGSVYPDNYTFEQDFIHAMRSKLIP